MLMKICPPRWEDREAVHTGPGKGARGGGSEASSPSPHMLLPDPQGAQGQANGCGFFARFLRACILRPHHA